MWLKILLGVGLILAAIFAATLSYGAFRWNARTREIRERLEAARVPVHPRVVDFAELEGLPAVVQRYLRTVLKEGQPMVTAVSVRHRGSMNMSEAGEQWKPFTSEQRVIMQRPGFDWNARISMMPGMPARVHDAYVAGDGILRAAVLGLFTVANVSGTRDMAEGELLRFFAEAAWYPTALLPSQGVRWNAVDAHSARGSLRDGDIEVTLLFSFNQGGLLETIRAEARGRMVSGQPLPTPWQGRFWNYAERSGMRVPLDGEVAWVLPAGAKTYWRGSTTESKYEFAP
jgi:uncharacterized protein DUF6920